MLVMRILAVLIALGCVANVFAWLLTGERRHLDRAWRLARFALLAVLVFLGLLLLERALLPVF